MWAEAIAELLVVEVIAPLLRLPGALLAWAVRPRRTFKQVWMEGNFFLQFVAGIGIHILWIVLVVVL